MLKLEDLPGLNQLHGGFWMLVVCLRIRFAVPDVCQMSNLTAQSVIMGVYKHHVCTVPDKEFRYIAIHVYLCLSHPFPFL